MTAARRLVVRNFVAHAHGIVSRAGEANKDEPLTFLRYCDCCSLTTEPRETSLRRIRALSGRGEGGKEKNKGIDVRYIAATVKRHRFISIIGFTRSNKITGRSHCYGKKVAFPFFSQFYYLFIRLFYFK